MARTQQANATIITQREWLICRPLIINSELLSNTEYGKIVSKCVLAILDYFMTHGHLNTSFQQNNNSNRKSRNLNIKHNFVKRTVPESFYYSSTSNLDLDLERFSGGPVGYFKLFIGIINNRRNITFFLKFGPFGQFM